MNAETAAAVIRLAERFRFQTIDITGGAPEMNPHIEILLRKLAPLADTTILRSNLTAMAAARQERLVDLAAANGVTITASLPSLNETQAETQRGSKTFAASIKMLRELNGYGYGSVQTSN
jgi:molybdenum cofactor biosynthesis enzyme MoaA